MNRIYAKHFEFGNTPARATIKVAGLPSGANFELTGVAVLDLSTALDAPLVVIPLDLS